MCPVGRFTRHTGDMEVKVLDRIKNSRKTVGIKQSLKAVENKTAKTLFIARDADEKVTENLIKQCEINSIDIVYVDSMKQLGKACGIGVGAAAAALLKDDGIEG